MGVKNGWYPLLIIKYLLQLIALVRDHGGRKNLAKKTLVDERFLI